MREIHESQLFGGYVFMWIVFTWRATVFNNMCCCLSSEFTLRASAIISAPTHPCICLLLESDCQNGRHWLRLHALNTPLLTGLMSIFRLLKMRNMSVYMREQTGLLRLHGHLKSIGIFRSYGRFRGKGWYYIVIIIIVWLVFSGEKMRNSCRTEIKGRMFLLS